MPPPAALLDVDGTLVDTNYHHALAWYRAFRRHEIVLPLWRIHRHIGMGGDQLVGSLCGEEVEERLGDDIRAAEKDLYMELIDEVEPLPRCARADRGAEAPRARGGAGELGEEPTRWTTTSTCSTRASWWTAGPPPRTSSARSRTPTWSPPGSRRRAAGEAVMVGDSTWDCEAARRVRRADVGLLTGGFSEQELREAGAVVVFESHRRADRRGSRTPPARRAPTRRAERHQKRKAPTGRSDAFQEVPCRWQARFYFGGVLGIAAWAGS